MKSGVLFSGWASESTTHLRNVSGHERGAVFTRREVVDFILDLVGYTVDQPLHRLRLLEPAFGQGDFLLPAIERLLAAYASQAAGRLAGLEELAQAIRAVEVHRDSVERTKARLLPILLAHGLSSRDAQRVIAAWLIEGDFLLVDLPEGFTHAVGNPPYVRQELVPDALLSEYRARYRTIYDRADLYIPFLERCLSSLAPGGALGFICADRWMKNKYGGPLRAMVAEEYNLACYVDMVDTPAFHSDVMAYPAITVIKREKAGPTRIARRPRVDAEALAKLSQVLRSDTLPTGSGVVERAGVVRGSEPWLLHSFDQLSVVRRLEAEFPPSRTPAVR